MTTGTWLLAMIYLLSGAGVLLALNDDDRPLGFGGILIAVVYVAIWPMFFMFALTTYFRSMAEQRPIDIAVRRRDEPTTATNQVG